MIKHSKQVFELQFNRAYKMNSFNCHMGRILFSKVKEHQLDDPQKVLLVTSGDCLKAFCAGGDIVSLTNDYLKIKKEKEKEKEKEKNIN